MYDLQGKNYMNLDFSYPLGQEIKYLTMVKSNEFFKPQNMVISCKTRGKYT